MFQTIKALAVVWWWIGTTVGHGGSKEAVEEAVNDFVETNSHGRGRLGLRCFLPSFHNTRRWVFYFYFLVWFFFFFITQFSSLITHHFKYYTCLAPSLNFHHSIFFTLFVGLIPVTRCSFFFFSIPKLIEPSGKKKMEEEEEEEEEETQNKPNQWKKKKKPNSQPGEERRKKRSKVATRYCLWVPYVCLITILSLSYELWKLKILKMYFQFP